MSLLLFCFLYFCGGSQLSAAGTRIVSIVMAARDWLLSEDAELGFVACLALLCEEAFDKPILEAMEADHSHTSTSA